MTDNEDGAELIGCCACCTALVALTLDGRISHHTCEYDDGDGHWTEECPGSGEYPEE